jgi:RNA polymerase-associated protein
MILYSCPIGAASHALRLMLAEKGLAATVVDVVPPQVPEDLLDLNPFGTAPTLVDRQLVIHEPLVALEYLDERHPHPPLAPREPVGRARLRQAALRIERDWYTAIAVIEGRSDRRARDMMRQRLRESLIASGPLFGASGHFLFDTTSLLDCLVAPVLWRLGRAGVEVPPAPHPARRYLARLVNRPAFLRSLTAQEKEFIQAS